MWSSHSDKIARFFAIPRASAVSECVCARARYKCSRKRIEKPEKHTRSFTNRMYDANIRLRHWFLPTPTHNTAKQDTVWFHTNDSMANSYISSISTFSFMCTFLFIFHSRFFRSSFGVILKFGDDICFSSEKRSVIYIHCNKTHMPWLKCPNILVIFSCSKTQSRNVELADMN